MQTPDGTQCYLLSTEGVCIAAYLCINMVCNACRRASELRSTLTYVEETKATLQGALDSLQKHGQPEHAAAVESMIQAALAAGDLLGNDVAHAKQALAKWHASVVTEATLSEELKHGTSAHSLSKAIQVRVFQY